MEVIIVDRGEKVGVSLGTDISQSIAQACEVPEVKWSLKSSIVAVDDSGVTLDDGHHIEAKTVIWTTDVRANT
ncbi:hypothetical protein [Pseudomonas weihenstephanensis]|uniref:Uncharacterized protein n=1 Tax=Pseudomonas weihenstephanensis TaxID=1608994 RepID=A0ABS1ZFH1_9PSED|nr:hypothetical protein [Pseudomonas weihenstephanensis]MBM1195214.1 hypothetical protein [Pseudomonas weihenstephanensis]